MKIQREIKIPSVPNFILCDGIPVPIAEFSNKELMEIGKLWTKELVKKAEIRRGK